MRASSPTDRTRRFWLGAALALATAGCAAPGAGDETRRALAPTGTLRIAVYAGSPTSLVREAPPEQMRGVAVDIGREMAKRLGVPAQVVVHPRVAEVVAALQRGEADMTITNATAERAALLDFAPPLVALELGLLVRAGVALDAVVAMDRPGLRLGVSQGSSSERVLRERLKNAQLQALPSLRVAREALVAGTLDAFATNKAVLFEMADGVPGARVLDGRWGLEHLAIGVPKGRAAGLGWLREFNAAVQADGSVARAAERAALRGTAPPDAR